MKNFLIICLSVLLNCIAQLTMRKGMLTVGEISVGRIGDIFHSVVTNLWLWGAVVCYVLSMLVWMYVLSKVEVSYAFPLGSIGYVLVAIAGYFFLGEQVTLLRLLGILVICLGVLIVSKS